MSLLQPTPAGITRSLSARLLLLTIVFVLIGEVLIYVPSIARARLVYLEERLAASHLATLAIEAAPDGVLAPQLEEELLRHSGVLGVALRRPEASLLMIGGRMPEHIDATFDLRTATPVILIRDAFATLLQRDERMIRVLGWSRQDPEVVVDVAMSEAPLREEMLRYSRRILNVSIILSVITAVLVYLSLQWLMVRPTRRITRSLVDFRRNPEDAATVLSPSRRSDEIGVLERELAEMQADIRNSLVQKTRLAALGAAMSRINHDLRNSLSSAMIVSDRLARSEDPEVQKVTPRLMAAIDRAVSLCTQTLEYAHSQKPKLTLKKFDLDALVDDVGEYVGLPADGSIRWENQVPERFPIVADHDQLFRVLLNLGRNAVEAMPDGGAVRFEAARRDGQVAIDIVDEGGGLPQRARDNLFQPFAGSGRRGGTGLGLAIARELVRAHGGEVFLLETSEHGTRFRLTIPDRE